MLMTLTSEYALRAMVYLARQGDERRIAGKEVAEAAEIPRKYLSRVLAELVRAGVLDASRGRHGGFRLARSPGAILLQDVLQPFERVIGTRRPCPFGAETCTDEEVCAGHHRWKLVRDAYAQFLHETTLADVSGDTAVSGGEPVQVTVLP